MPSPHRGNDRAARYVSYYGSSRMVDATVNRLYHGGLAQKKAAEAKAEQEAYPPTQAVRRTQEQIDAYLLNRVEAEVLRRKQRRAALRQELYPEVDSPPRFITPGELQKHVRNVYTDPIRRRQLREREIERIFGKNRSTSELGVTQSREQAKDLREREQHWRPPSTYQDYDDNRRYLVSQYDYFADPHRFTELQLREKGPLKAERREALMKRLTSLAHPGSITPRVVSEERGPRDPPPFRVHRTVDRIDL